MKLGILTGLVLLAGCAQPGRAQDGRPPNVVLIFCDDMGYADVGVYGAQGYRTPHIDRLAAEGVRFTDFYVAQAVCSASRAALLTGCYSNRVSIQGALFPGAKTGLHPDEITIAELLKSRGYATAAFGKWHLGDHEKFLPTRQGFDEYFGLPYSNDMWPRNRPTFPPLPLIDGEKAVETDPDQSRLTARYTERAVQFIEKVKDKPFFIYLAHTMPHVPIFVSEGRRGATGSGTYADVIAEIDWSVGVILDALRARELDERTLVIFTSDNGPWLTYGDHAGSARPFREGKATAFEGGIRVPCVMRWPGKVPAGTVCREPAMTIDLSPTISRLAGEEPPKDRVIDGRDIWPLISGTEGARSPHDALLFYWGRELHAIRSGRWKLHLRHPYPHVSQPGAGGKPGKSEPRTMEPALFDLESDPGESRNVAEAHPDVVRRLQAIAEAAREDLGDALVKREGRNVRPVGRLP